jgi:hypothetical protein
MRLVWQKNAGMRPFPFLFQSFQKRLAHTSIAKKLKVPQKGFDKTGRRQQNQLKRLSKGSGFNYASQCHLVDRAGCTA